MKASLQVTPYELGAAGTIILTQSRQFELGPMSGPKLAFGEGPYQSTGRAKNQEC